jgi:hypothetical protein
MICGIDTCTLVQFSVRGLVKGEEKLGKRKTADADTSIQKYMHQKKKALGRPRALVSLHWRTLPKDARCN